MKHLALASLSTTNSAVTTLAAMSLAALMMVPLGFFLTMCWVDSRAQRRRIRRRAQLRVCSVASVAVNTPHSG